MADRLNKTVSSAQVIRTTFGAKNTDNPFVLYTDCMRLLRELYRSDSVSTWRRAMEAVLGKAVPMHQCDREKLKEFRAALQERRETMPR